MMCIYKIDNISNGKFYIGSAQVFARREKAHMNKLKRNAHKNSHLQSSYNKYGKDSFVFSILEEVDNQDMLIKREQYFIDTLKPEYNMCPTAGSSLGRKHKYESIEKIRASSILRKDYPETLEALKKGREYYKGKKFSEEHKARLSIAKNSVKIPVYSRDKDGNCIYYESLTAVKKDGFSAYHVSEVCRGISKTHKKLEWKYA